MKKLILKNKKILFSVDINSFNDWKHGSDNAIKSKVYKTKTEIFEDFCKYLISRNIEDLKEFKKEANKS